MRFSSGEVDLRINIYRGQVATDDLNNDYRMPDTMNKVPYSANKVPYSANKVPDSANKVPDSVDKVPDSTNKVPDNEQEQKIYRYVSENESITTAETVELLKVKPRRARVVLRNMVNSGCLRKEGTARSTIYVKNMEGK